MRIVRQMTGEELFRIMSGRESRVRSVLGKLGWYSVMAPLLWLVAKLVGSNKLILIEEEAWDTTVERLYSEGLTKIFREAAKVSGDSADKLDVDLEEVPDDEQLH